MNDSAPSDPTASSPRPRGFVLATILLACGLVGIGLVVTEFALRALGPRETQYFVLRPDLRVEFDPDPRLTPGISGRARFTVNSLGLRGEELPAQASARRILVVGGSTTENVYLDDTETWTHILQVELEKDADARAVWVGAAGRGGMNARDHVVQVGRLLESMPRPDRLIVLVGVNDLTIALAQGDTFRAPPPLSDPEARRVQERRAFTVVPGALNELAGYGAGVTWYRRTALWQLASRVRGALGARGGRQLQQDTRAEAVQRWREARARATKVRDSLPSMIAALAEYRQNLESIIGLADAKGIPVSFLSQPSLWRADLDSNETRLLWFGGVGDFQRAQADTYYSPAVLARAMDAFNQALLGVCDARALECLDLASSVPRSTEYFFDDVHFTERGAKVVGEATARWLRPILDRSATR